jgi:DNA ligase-1
VRLAEIVTTSQRVREASGRREKIALLADCLRRLEPAEIAAGASWLSGTLPQGRIGLGWAQLGPATGGEPALEPTLTVGEVDAALTELAAIGGAGSVAERARRLQALFARATLAERAFLVPLLGGELRQGALAGVMTEAVAAAAGLPADDVRRARMVEGDLGRVARLALCDGAAGLATLSIRLFVPVLPMLADTADDVGDALAHLGTAAFEYKLDGARVQVHRAGDEVRVYTRRLNEVTDAVPEVVAAARALDAREVILDGEAIAVRPDGRPHDFQDTMRRFGRKLDVDRQRAELPLRAFFFDCLYLDGRPLVDHPGAARAELLAQLLPAALRIPRLVTDDRAAAQAFFDGAIAAGHEGLVAKSLTALYEAGRRGQGWLKVKRAKTLDLVVLAAEWGHGRRHGFLSNLHLGARGPGPAGEPFVMLGKTFKGMTDEMLAWQTRRLQELETSRDGHTVFVRPELVVEVAFDGVQRSRYPGGVALRFARVKRYRPDKSAAEADTLETVVALAGGVAPADE